jgi:hypothetical protein
MKLIQLQHNKPIPEPECLTIKAFAKIYDRDRTKGKEVAIQELAYIYFMADYTSIYHAYEPELRDEKIIEDTISIEGWKPDDDIKEAILKYKELQETPTMGLLRDAKTAIDKIRSYLRNVDIRLDKTGKISQTLISNIKSLGDLVKGLNTLEDQVKKELSDVRIRGGIEAGEREIPRANQTSYSPQMAGRRPTT